MASTGRKKIYFLRDSSFYWQTAQNKANTTSWKWAIFGSRRPCYPALKRGWSYLLVSTRLHPHCQNLTQSPSQPETDQIQADFAQYHDPGHLWKNTNESGKLAAGRLHSARTRPNDYYTPACFQTRHVWPKPDLAIQIGSRPVLHNMIQAFFGRMEPNWNCMWELRKSDPAFMVQPDSGCMLAIMAITGCKYCNQNAEVWRYEYDREAWSWRAHLL